MCGHNINTQVCPQALNLCQRWLNCKFHQTNSEQKGKLTLLLKSAQFLHFILKMVKLGLFTLVRLQIVWKDFSDHSPQSAPLHCLSSIPAALPLLRSSHFGRRFSLQLLRLIKIPEKTTPYHLEHPHLNNSKRVFGEVQWHLCLWPLKQVLPNC